MDLQDFFKQSQRLLEAKNHQDYRYSEMAKKIGVSERTYGEYMRGHIDPLAAKAVLNLLSEMDDADVIRVVREWKKSNKHKIAVH